MSTRKSTVVGLGLFPAAVIVLAFLLIPPADAQAITFAEWATNHGWYSGYVAPGGVYADHAYISSLAGMGDYDWTTTPTKYLGLYNNQITSIESGAFTGLGSLATLHMHNNQITSIESGDFAGLGSLVTLVLNSNRIATIGPGAFIGLSSLTSLSLNSNQITNIASGVFTGLNSLQQLTMSDNTALTNLNLDGGDFSNLTGFSLSNDVAIKRVSLRNAHLNNTSLDSLVGGGVTGFIGIGELSGITKLDLSAVDFAAVTNLSPLYMMDGLTELWLVGARNLNANSLDTLLDNLATMENPSVEGTLCLTQADFNAWNAAGGGKLTIWDAEPGHHVEILGSGDANADGVVDQADAVVLASHWHQMGGAQWFDGDFNGDGNVTDADASILAAHWDADADELGPTVPEPTTLAMLVGAVVSVGLVAYRHRCGRQPVGN